MSVCVPFRGFNAAEMRGIAARFNRAPVPKISAPPPEPVSSETVRKFSTRPEYTPAQLVEAYVRTGSSIKVANEFGCAAKTVLDAVRAAGLTPNQQGGRSKDFANACEWLKQGHSRADILARLESPCPEKVLYSAEKSTGITASRELVPIRHYNDLEVIALWNENGQSLKRTAAVARMRWQKVRAILFRHHVLRIGAQKTLHALTA